jgi:hypothetical protein
MVVAGLVVETIFGGLGLIPDQRNAKVVEASVTWNYTTFFNIVFLLLAAVLVVRFMRTGGPEMLRMMGGPPKEPVRDIDSAHIPPETDEEPAYACPMHPEVTSSGEGNCAKCGMRLERLG